MSQHTLLSDFRNYYNSTWIAILGEDGILNPFFVDEVRQRGNFSSTDYSHEAELALYFRGSFFYKDESGKLRRKDKDIGVFDNSVMLESPDVGYLLYGRKNNMISWVQITPIRKMSKGVTYTKVQSTLRGRLNGKIMYDLFNPEFRGLINRNLFICNGTNKIYYKGCFVGKKLDKGNKIHLLSQFKHIKDELQDFEVIVKEKGKWLQ